MESIVEKIHGFIKVTQGENVYLKRGRRWYLKGLKRGMTSVSREKKEELDLQILNKNLKPTNWGEARYENGKIVAEYYGSKILALEDGNLQPYEGVNTFEIFPEEEYFHKIFDYGFDQEIFLNIEWSLPF